MSKLATLFSFNGRIPRSQFWGVFYMLILLTFIVGFPFAFMDAVVTTPTVGDVDILGLVGFSLIILFMVVITTTTVKRFHDRDRSGLWALISLTGIGLLWVIIECGLLKGTVGPNRFGENPVYRKAVTTPSEK
ncbi:MAG: hypothetical protein UW27_C0013G0002 [Parcubacteria group bacterium GW2011_GWA1_44_13]|nr:MAG: hypothetical protein UW27_C0013G0002 [Parcubacteria group bacterium GW2011_GWA1_44_13]HBB44263.1 hypothetical protein [Candidatus Yonathbacteria bacterium]